MPIFKVEMLDDQGTTVHIAAAQITDEDTLRYFTAYKAIYGVPDISDDDMFRLFAVGLIQGVISNVRNFELAEATRQIETNVITFIPLTAQPLDADINPQGLESVSEVANPQFDIHNDQG